MKQPAYRTSCEVVKCSLTATTIQRTLFAVGQKARSPLVNDIPMGNPMKITFARTISAKFQ